MQRLAVSKVVLAAACLLLGSTASSQEQDSPRPSSTAASAEDFAALQAEVERLKSIVPGQAFAMTQVAYNFTNLWFAVQEENWPLAEFYLNETRVRLRWAVRVTPVRRTSAGSLELQPILDGIEQTYLAALKQSLEDRNSQQFAASYDETLGGCYGCHVAIDKPYLRLVRPARPAEALIKFSPD
jgi:hypothetical protein